MPSPRTRLTLAFLALAALSLTPRPWLAPVTYLNGPLVFLLAPIQHPVRSFAIWLRGPQRREGIPTEAQVQELTRQRDEYQRSLLAIQQENESLRALLRDVARMSELNPTPVRLVVAPVIGFGADLSGGVFTVHAGRKDGVEKNSAAVVRGVYLIGRVQRVEDRTAAIQPITDKAFPRFTGRIMLDDKTAGPRCTLKAAGDGTLTGEVWEMTESAAAPDSPARPSLSLSAAPKIEPGMTVRLDDETWPPGEQMLVIGTVTRTEPSPTQMQRLLVHVQPTQDISHVSEVMIRVSDTQSPPAAKPPEGKPTP